VAGTPNAETNCGGNFTPLAGAPTFSFTGGVVAASDTCTVSVDVLGLRVGTLENMSGDLKSFLPDVVPGAMERLTVTPAAAPGFARAFSPDTVDPTGISTLTFTIDNTANAIAVGALRSTTLAMPSR